MAQQNEVVGFLSLSGVASGTPTGLVLDNGGNRFNHSAIITAGAGVTAGTVVIQVSQDNVSWFQPTTGQPAALAAAGVTGGTVSCSAQYARAVVTVAPAGGTITSVTLASTGS